MRTHHNRVLQIVCALAVAAPLSMTPTAAQSIQKSATVAETTVPAEMIPMFAARTADVIRVELGAARIARDAADDDQLDAQSAVDEAVRRVDAQKLEIESIDDQIDAAADAKQEAEKDRLEILKDEAEDLRELLEKHVDLSKALLELAEARSDVALATINVYQRELELERASDERRAEQEMHVLDALKDMHERAKDVSDREKRVVERRIDVLKAQNKIRDRSN